MPLTKDTNKVRLSVAIMAMGFSSLALSAASPALANIEQAFPEVAHIYIAMLSTIPALISMPFELLTGMLAGKKVSFRNMSIIAFVLMVLGGLGPVVSNSFFLILFWRIVLGAGMGIVYPMAASLVYLYFTKDEAEVQISYHTMVSNFGAVVFQLSGGLLCANFGWRATFLAYTLLLPCALLVLLLLPRNEKKIEAPGGEHARKYKFGWATWKWCLLYFVFCMLFYPLITESSGIILSNGYGDAAGTSVLLTLFTFGGVAGGFLYRYVRQLEERCFALAFALCAIGFLMILLAGGLITMVVGATVFGVGYGLFMAVIMVVAGYAVPPEARSNAAAYLLAAAGLGEFFSSFSTSFVLAVGNGRQRFPFLVSTVAFTLFALIFLKKPKEHSCAG